MKNLAYSIITALFISPLATATAADEPSQDAITLTPIKQALSYDGWVDIDYREALAGNLGDDDERRGDWLRFLLDTGAGDDARAGEWLRFLLDTGAGDDARER